MTIPFPRTKGQWIAVVVLTILAILLLYRYTNVFQGQAVELSVENASQKAIFVHVDNTGRHGQSTPTVKLKTTMKGETPAGLLIQPGTTRSFGTAVGLGDSPTLHIWPVTESGLADTLGVSDCAFDTISWKKIEIPSIHAKVKWTGSRCEPVQ